jgi:hypothetical protein
VALSGIGGTPKADAVSRLSCLKRWLRAMVSTTLSRDEGAAVEGLARDRLPGCTALREPDTLVGNVWARRPGVGLPATSALVDCVV